MKNILYVILLIPVLGFTQFSASNEANMNSYLWLGLWDSENSTEKFYIDKIGYDEIPRNLEFRGVLVEAIKWKDTLGTNILVLTQTGGFKFKDYLEDSTGYTIQQKAELSAYLFRKDKNEIDYKRRWKVFDYAENFGVDMYVGFIKRSITVTDLDNDGVAEVTMPYQLIVRGGMDPGILKIILYENSEKYAIRGSTAICYKGEDDKEYIDGGDYKLDEKLKRNILFLEFLRNRWDIHKCEKW